MNRLFALLSALLIASAAFAAPGLKPGGVTEFNVELPRDLRLMAGRGQLSPVTHVIVTIATPLNLDMAHDWPILVISATSDPQYNSSRLLLTAYADVALANGWIVVAADPVQEITLAQDDVPMRLALTTAALAALDLKWPAAYQAPIAFGGFSGGAKYSGWLAAAFASQGRQITGIYLAGINADAVVPAAEQFNVLNANFKRVPIFLQVGSKDDVATPNDNRTLYDELKRKGFKNVRLEYFDGGHEVDPLPLGKALEWFRSFAVVPVPAK